MPVLNMEQKKNNKNFFKILNSYNNQYSRIIFQRSFSEKLLFQKKM